MNQTLEFLGECFSSRLKITGNVHVWYLDVSLIVDISSYLLFLDQEETHQSSKIQHPVARKRFVLCRSIRKILIATYSGISVKELIIVANRFEKPFIKHNPSGLQFSSSYAGVYLAIAFSTAGATGIDIVEKKTISESDQLANWYFHPEERQYLKELLPAHADLAFLKLWACKESVAKALGYGITKPGFLESFNCARIVQTGEQQTVNAEGKSLIVSPVGLSELLFDAVAVEGRWGIIEKYSLYPKFL